MTLPNRQLPPPASRSARPEPEGVGAATPRTKKIRVALADDSNFHLKRLTSWLEAEGDMEVVATADNGMDAVEDARRLRPDLIILDDKMPKMRGLEALRDIMRTCPTPTLIFCDRASSPERERRLREKATELGALDVFVKPSNEEMTEHGGELGALFRRKARMLSKIKVVRLLQRSGGDSLDGVLTPPPAALVEARRRMVADAAAAQAAAAAAVATANAAAEEEAAAQAAEEAAGSASVEVVDKAPGRERRIVLVGSSTGGPDAVRVILSRLPASFPFPIVIAQHMPKGFTRDFATQLARVCPLPVSEATNKDVLDFHRGHVYVAPGDHNLWLRGLGFQILPADKSGSIGRARQWVPSIDELFKSAAARYKEGAVGVILTGLGNDGEKGVRSVKAVGGVIISQDEKTSNIFGMPKEAIATGCVDVVAPLDEIAQWIVHYTTSASRASITAP
jgi:two-component system chemotaxis response regulator CheB